jgi:hypothetical protein
MQTTCELPTIYWASFYKRPITIFAQSPALAASCLVGMSGALLIMIRSLGNTFVGSGT